MNIPPRPPGKPGAPGKLGKPGGGAPPTPAAGPYGMSAIFQDIYVDDGGDHTAKEGGAAPLPAGRATPGPAARADEIPPGALFPRRALGSSGGGDSTDSEMM